MKALLLICFFFSFTLRPFRAFCIYGLFGWILLKLYVFTRYIDIANYTMDAMGGNSTAMIVNFLKGIRTFRITK